MYFRLTNHFFLHVGVPLMIGLSFLLPDAAGFRLTLLAAALHEGCHAVMAFCLRVPVLRLTILPYGCHLRLAPVDLMREAKIAAAGPAGSLFLYFLFRDKTFGKINLILFLINLLPALPLDGGRLVRLLLLRNQGTYFVSRTLRRMGVLSCIFMVLYGFFIPSPFALCIAVLLFSYARSLPVPLLQKKAIRTRRVKIFHARSTDSLLSLSHYFSPFYSAAFSITDRGFLLTEAEITAILRQNAAARVSDVPVPRRLPPLSG
ncbi:MAG: hypothetical protein E7390_03905 [Ruminococcaceae bacterium]|nr:hypothetical protein [Oscillospiraceae bacterium]